MLELSVYLCVFDLLLLGNKFVDVQVNIIYMYVFICILVFIFLFFKIDIYFKKYSYIIIKSMYKLFRLYMCNL